MTFFIPEKILISSILGFYSRVKSKILRLLRLKINSQKFESNKRDIYIIHHLACTGGSLISKLIRNSFNCVLVSEINPGYAFGSYYFSPHDLLSQFSFASNKSIRTFQQAIENYNRSLDFCIENIDIDQFLVIRDWSDGDFYSTNLLPHICSTKDWIDSKKYNIHSVITVRHPIESFISKVKSNWQKDDNKNSLEIYCRKYLYFLNHYEFSEIFYYENICCNHKSELKKLSKIWSKKFKNIKSISQKKISGDSGRSSTKIMLRASKNISKELRDQMNSSHSYNKLCKRLGYKADIEENSLNFFN